jgi:Protein kinase domain
LSNLIIDKTFHDGQVIFDPLSNHDAALYILREGNVKLAGERVDDIKPGGYFGENMLLLDAKQQTTIGEQAPTTKCLPSYSAKAVGTCICGVLSLSECRTIFATTKMIDVAAGMGKVAIDEKEMEDEMAAAALPTSVLNRESTSLWLEGLSKEILRTTVRKTIGLDDLERIQVLGEGQFGEVWLVSANLEGDLGRRHFALKAQHKDDPSRGDSVDAIKYEIDVLGVMDHPFIVSMVHHYEDPERIYILMGVVHGGELFDVIHTEQEDGTYSSGLPESDAKFYAMVIADTLNYIHRQRYVFRDMKPENVLIDKDGYPVICDFGFGEWGLMY